MVSLVPSGGLDYDDTIQYRTVQYQRYETIENILRVPYHTISYYNSDNDQCFLEVVVR
ncbi:hypothetical protein ACHAXS_006715 [Conticribra weissflogii]